MVRRNPNSSAFAGAWTFPGGHIDAGDQGGGGVDEKVAARRAAVREAQEEAGLEIDPEGMIFVSRWTTPECFSRRFRTWFFLTDGGDRPVRIDGAEIVDHRWITPADALAGQGAGKMELPPPIFVLTTILSAHRETDAAYDYFRRTKPLVLTPRIATVPGGLCFLYPEDAGYTASDPESPGPRHRLWALKSGWRYVPPTDSQSPHPCR